MGDSQNFFEFAEIISSQPQLETLNQEPEYDYQPTVIPEQPQLDNKENKIHALLVANIISQTNLTRTLTVQGNQLTKRVEDLTTKVIATVNCTNSEFNLLRTEIKELDEKLNILLAKRSSRLEKDSERRKRKKADKEREIEDNFQIVTKLRRSS
jgi:hypothetical protein